MTIRKKRRKASSTRLEPGQHSIDRNTPTERMVRGRPRMVLDWSVRLHDGLLIKDRRTQGATKTEVRARARQQVAELLARGSGPRQWRLSDPVEKYIDAVAYEEIASANLRPQSRRRYRDLVGHLREQLKGRSISQTMHFDVLLGAVDAVGQQHGKQAGRQAKTVLGRYITLPMIRHRLIDHDPLRGYRLELHRYPVIKEGPKRGGQGLSAEEHVRVIEHLLTLDPAAGVEPPRRGKWTLHDRIERNRRIIGLTLFQSGTGLRISEALQITPELLWKDEKGQMYVHVTPEIAKTGIGRNTPVLLPVIQTYMEQMLEQIGDQERYLFGTPSDPTKRWRADGSTGASHYVAELYRSMAEQLEISQLEHLRTHLWRTTLGSRCEEAGIPRDVYAPFLGHDTATNKKYYTEGIDLTAAVSGFRAMYAAA